MSRRVSKLARRTLGLVAAGTLALSALNCGPISALRDGARPALQPTADPYGTVRQRAQAAFERGQTFLQAGDFERALVELDTARLNDPDNRPEIQAALDQALAALRLTPTRALPTRPPTATPDPAAPLNLLAGGAGAVTTPTARPSGTPGTPGATSSATPRSAARTPTPVASQPTPSPAPPTAVATPTVALGAYHDPEGRFTLSLAPGWTTIPTTGAEAGTPLATFADSARLATLTLSVEPLADDLSPELFAARLETAMQALPGYRSLGIQPTTLDGRPAVQRSYVVAGPTETFQTVQLVVVDRRSVLLITGTCPASYFAVYAPFIDRMIASVRLEPRLDR